MNLATHRWLVGFALALLLSAPGPLVADETDDKPLTGGFRLGYRLVDVNGAETKYREDFDLQEGAHLFEFDLEMVPTDGGTRKVLDRFELGASNLGGEAFEAFRLSAEKRVVYDLDYRRTEFRYFYEDTIVPHSLADPRLSDGGDFRVGFKYAWLKVTLILEESVRNYENAVEVFLPGFSLGENTTNNTTLDFFFLDQPYEYTAQQHTVRVNARPTKRWRIQASAAVQSLDLDVEATEESQGIAFNSQPFTTDVRGAGEIERDLDFFDIDLSSRLSDRVGLIAGVRRYELDQEGEFEFDVDGRGLWQIETTGFELGAQAHLTPEWTVS
ncbi:MAG: hypothetical protein AAF481_08730 [Acidobacteriota bacterium]